MIDEALIGKTIKKLRVRKGLTLQALADATGYTKGYLSKVEKSAKAPPVATLLNIASVLGVNPSVLFGEAGSGQRFSLVRSDDREVIARNPDVLGYEYEGLIRGMPRRMMHAFALNGSGETKRLVSQHDGEEMFFVLEGTVQFHYDGDDYVLEQGDCIYFDSRVPHYVDTVSPGGKALFVAASESGMLPQLVPPGAAFPQGSSE